MPEIWRLTMKTISIKEYLILSLKSVTLRGLLTGLVLLCFLLLMIQLMEVGLKGLLLAGLLFAVYKVLAAIMSLLRQGDTSGGVNVSDSLEGSVG